MNTVNSPFLKKFTLTGIIIGALILGVFIFSFQNDSQAKEIHRITSIGQSSSSASNVLICGELNDNRNTFGTLTNPIELKKGGGPKMILFCIQAPDEEPKTWKISATHSETRLLPPQGLIVNLDKEILDMPAREGSLKEFIENRDYKKPDFIASVRATDEAPLGKQYFNIWFLNEREEGYETGLARAIYVNITD